MFSEGQIIVCDICTGHAEACLHSNLQMILIRQNYSQSSECIVMS